MDLNHGKILRLKGVFQHYSWGGFEFIPQLLDISNEEGRPFAEYWLGAHPNHPSMANGKALDEWIREDPVFFLGETVAKKYNSLPYLFKVLDVRQMLSIQVHPSKSTAEAAFAEENKKGIPINAAQRNYKDRNHKPEMMIALGDFWLLHGFKDEASLLKKLASVPELVFLSTIFTDGGYRALYERLMFIEQREVNEIIRPLVERIVPLYNENRLDRNDEDFWAARAALHFCRKGNFDRGIFSIYLFNLVHLKKGEGIFQSSGLPHAYLEGQNIEVMANSDNVLRAGLTDKYIDVDELMKHVEFRPTEPEVLHPPEIKGQRIFSTAAEEFEVHEFSGESPLMNFQSPTADLFFVLKGEMQLSTSGGKQLFKKGEGALVAAHASLELKAFTGADLFRVTLPS